MIPSDSIQIRLFKPEDLAFVYSTWLRNYKHSSYFAKRIKPSVFFEGHHKVLDSLFKKPELKVFIATPKDDPDTILGYIACELATEELNRTVIHFSFVKEAFRRMGVARALCKAAQVDFTKASFTHWTFPVDEIYKKLPDMTYNPYLL